MTLGIFPRQTWTRPLNEAGFEHVAIAGQAGRDVFQAILA
jgi:hypothetical protein